MLNEHNVLGFLFICLDLAARRGLTDMVPSLAERNLLSRFKGDAKPQSKSARPAPSLALSLRVGSEEETQKRPVSATIHGHDYPSYPSLGRGSSGHGRVPQQPVPPAAACSVAAPASP